MTKPTTADAIELPAGMVFTEGPDGRLFVSKPRAEGDKTLTFEATGEAAKFLRETGYVVRVTVERLDGGGFTESGREFVTAAVLAEARGEDAREAAAKVHFKRALERLDAKEAAERDAAVRKAG